MESSDKDKQGTRPESKVVDGGAVSFSPRLEDGSMTGSLEGKVDATPIITSDIPVLDVARLATVHDAFLRMQKYLGREQNYDDIKVAELNLAIAGFLKYTKGYIFIKQQLLDTKGDLSEICTNLGSVYKPELLEKNPNVRLDTPRQFNKTVYNTVTEAIRDINEQLKDHEPIEHMRPNNWLNTAVNNITDLLRGLDTNRNIAEVMILANGLHQAITKINNALIPIGRDAFSKEIAYNPEQYVSIVEELSGKVLDKTLVKYNCYVQPNGPSISGFIDKSPPPVIPNKPKGPGIFKRILNYLDDYKHE